MSTIALKIGSLVVRTLAKPIANSIKARAKIHGPFRQSCIAVAQALHSTDVRLRSGLLGSAGKAKVRPLNDAKAIEMGANFLSETFLFSVAASAVIYESVRSSRKASSRQESVADDIAQLQREVIELKAVLEKLTPEASKIQVAPITATVAAAAFDGTESHTEVSVNQAKVQMSSSVPTYTAPLAAQLSHDRDDSTLGEKTAAFFENLQSQVGSIFK
ncbi:optic atrophy 3 protein-domain-containing protein [Lipomyces arxii]|uniref:optic atrophy 3 protein-domain-containing protein n=1 Tax=Lipomyces arxii TaxID=56418 RepID=UPI0034CF6C12